MELLFYTSLFILFYSYLGYGVLVYVLLKIKRLFSVKEMNAASSPFYPPVTLIIAAYNESAVLREKIVNCLSLEYPAANLEILFVIDGSTDSSALILGEHRVLKTLFQPARMGKTAALNRAVNAATNEILIFSDANTLLNSRAIVEIAACYQNAAVGGVAGEKKVMKEGFTDSDEGEGLYWKYESTLKKLDSELHTVVGAAGELFSLRKSLFEPLDESIILDDFVLSMRITLKGYTVKYTAAAFAMELPSVDAGEEMKRKIRISAGGFQAMALLSPLLNIFRFPVVSFQYISHRVLRWTLCPLALIVLVFSNLLLLQYGTFQLLFIAQLAFYSAALTGWLLIRAGHKAGPLYVPYYFSMMNLALVLGFIRYLGNKQSAVWEKAVRRTSEI